MGVKDSPKTNKFEKEDDGNDDSRLRECIQKNDLTFHEYSDIIDRFQKYKEVL